MTNDRSENPLRLHCSREEQFVLDAVVAFIGNRAASGIRVPEDLNGDRVEQIVHINNIGPVFHHVFRDHPLPLHALGGWGQLRMKVLFANVQKLRVAVRLFSLLDAAGIRSVGLRGVTLANLYYPEPGVRPMKDLDILVDADAGPRVLEAMSVAGFETTNRLRSQLVYTIEGVEIEIHLSLLTAKRYRAAFNADLLLGSRVAVKTGEGTIYRLTLEHELLELVAHAFVHHELQGFTRMMDVALVMSRKELDWSAIGRWCSEARLTNMFLFTLSLADALFGLGSGEFRSVLGAKLPRGTDRMFRSYLKLYFGGDSLLHYLRRKRNMLYAAERPSVKMNQFWRLFSASHFRELKQVMRKGKAPLFRG